jgi:putative PIN family toxin of toxin-antitoxin system
MGAVGVVVDTNVLISAFGFGGTPLDAVLRAFGSRYRLVASEETLEELSQVMAYDRLPFTDQERELYPVLLRREAELVSPDTTPAVIDADPDDNEFLACASTGDADYIVSGDSHLLDLEEYHQTEIVSPAAFLERTQ